MHRTVTRGVVGPECSRMDFESSSH
uniref:Uncharacterized protein n=1 Tax=Anguilla anguilla TaxID=7936 RepID=A0A0E9TGD6_ANGAN